MNKQSLEISLKRPACPSYPARKVLSRQPMKQRKKVKGLGFL